MPALRQILALVGVVAAAFLLAAALSLAAFVTRARAEPYRPHCTDPGYCVERPGLVIDGFPASTDDTRPNTVTSGGTVTVAFDVMATPARVVAVGRGVAVVVIRGRALVVPQEAVLVDCPTGRLWLGGRPVPFRCP